MRKTTKVALTGVQDKALGYIIQCIEGSQRPPTVRELAGVLDVSYTWAKTIIDELARKGYLIKNANLARGIRLNPKKYTVQVKRK